VENLSVLERIKAHINTKEMFLQLFFGKKPVTDREYHIITRHIALPAGGYVQGSSEIKTKLISKEVDCAHLFCYDVLCFEILYSKNSTLFYCFVALRGSPCRRLGLGPKKGKKRR
jgi:hypothetical protein